MTVIKRFKDVYGPFLVETTKKVILSKSHKLFTENGLTKFSNGLGVLTPLTVRSLRKLETLVRREMSKISAQEILLPSLINEKLLDTSGRRNMPDLFKLNEVDEIKYVLGPTHEETITDFMASLETLRSGMLPCRFYQISHKFRDERRTKSGLLRSKEFIMKDLYCFDIDSEKSEQSYKEVIDLYNNFFQLLKVPHVVVESDPGIIGGLHSSEFHFLTKSGEDKILLCQNCGFKENSNKTENKELCSKCHSNNVKIENGIEVGHAFNLGTTYTKPFKATFLNDSNEKQMLFMGSFGLGLSRIVAATVEVLSCSNDIRWPLSIAPYLVCIIPFKSGMSHACRTPETIYHDLNNCLPDEVVLYDRPNISIGKRFIKAKKVGFPYVVILGKGMAQDPPYAEVHDVYSEIMDLVPVSDINQYIVGKLVGSSDKKILMGRNT